MTRLGASPSLVDQVLLAAACESFTSYVNTRQLPEGGDWTRFFAGTVAQNLVGVDPFYVQSKVDEMAALGELIEYNPYLAVRYAQGCWLVSPVVG